MKLLTADRTLVDVRHRAQFIQNVTELGGGRIELVPSLDGLIRYVSYEAIYRNNPWVFAGVGLFIDALSMFPLKTYRLCSDGDRERIRSDLKTRGPGNDAQRLDALVRTPTTLTPRATRVARIVKNRLVHGNALEEKRRRDDRRIDDLVNVPWWRVEILKEGTFLAGYRITEPDRDPRTLMPGDVIHYHRGDSEDGLSGVSPLEPLARQLKIQDAVARHVASYFANAARASGNLKFDKPPSEEARARIAEQIRTLYGGPENTGKVIISGGDWQSMSDPLDASVVDSIVKLGREEVAACLGIPIDFLVSGGNTAGNIRQFATYLVRNRYGSWTSFIEDYMNTQLVADANEPGWQGLFVEFDLSDLLRPDLEARAIVYQQTDSVYSPNEKRKMENLPPIGDPTDESNPANAVAVPMNKVMILPDGSTITNQPAVPQPKVPGPGTAPKPESTKNP